MSLREVIALTFAYYHRGEPLSDAVLNMYAMDLDDLDESACIQAYHTYRRNPANKFFPLPAQIREIVCPEENISPEIMAREISARIVGAVSKFGWSNARDAERFIGDEGWSVVQNQGGWSHLCENLGLNIQPTTFQAQVRDQLVGQLKHGSSAIERAIQNPRIESRPKQKELEPARFNTYLERSQPRESDDET